MVETWVDMNTGKLLVGAAVAETALQNGTEAMPLEQVLNQPDLKLTVPPDASPENYEKTWQRDDYIAYGRWLLKFVAPKDDQPQPLTWEHVDRLSKLRVGPGSERIMSQLGIPTLTAYRELIGSPTGRILGRYKYWSLADCLDYARNLETQLGRKPEVSDFDAACSRKEGPGSSYIKNRFGPISYINEHLGYPYVKSWEPDDYIHWGVKFMKANDGQTLTARVPRILAQRKRGPSDRAILDHFDTWNDYKQQVEEAYFSRLDFEVSERAEKLERYGKMARVNELPESFAELPADKLLPLAARYIVIEECLRGTLTMVQKETMARAPAHKLIRLLCEAKTGLSAGQIELTAETLGVYEDIWPIEENLEYLRLKPAELGYKKPGNRKRYTQRATPAA